MGDREMKAAGFTQKLPGVARSVVLPEVAMGIPDLQLCLAVLQLPVSNKTVANAKHHARIDRMHFPLTHSRF